MGVNRARTGGGAGVRPGHGDAGHSKEVVLMLLLKGGGKGLRETLRGNQTGHQVGDGAGGG